MTIGRLLLAWLLCAATTAGAALRDDVLVIVNDNSLDSPLVGAYYAEQRGIDPANVVHIRTPNSFFIDWDEFRRLRDQLIDFMQRNTLDDPALQPVVCSDGEPPFYCDASTALLRQHSRIRYLVTTRGVPTRVLVAGSSLFEPDAPASVDNYLKYVLLNSFADDVPFAFGEREAAFADGRSMRTVRPSQDRELIVGRIDGLDRVAAQRLVDRALNAEAAGLFGSWYGSTKFFRWVDATNRSAVYPNSGSVLNGWRYLLGLFGEDRPECVAYLAASGTLPEGKAPAYCRSKLNDDPNPATQSTLGINYPAPGNVGARAPAVVDALGYQGWLDGQSAVGSFAALLNWRKDASCTTTLCDAAADPAACRAASTDHFRELDTTCAGVADGFVGYNHQSYPVSYMAVWPTGWFQTDSTGVGGWFNPGHGDVDRLAFPEVRGDQGFDDSNSLWFRNTDQVPDPRCFAASDFSQPPGQPCKDARRVLLTQSIAIPATLLDAADPPRVRVALQLKAAGLTAPLAVRARLFVHEPGGGSGQLDYGVQSLAILPVGASDWTGAAVEFTLDPLRHASGAYDGLKLTLDTPDLFSGELGIDTVSMQVVGDGRELLVNGSFADGHRQVATGDHAAVFLSRLNGTAFWGSVGHHQSAGCAFCFNGLEMLAYFMRGLPLGDAVWFDESNNSGVLYGDPLYSPVAVRIRPVNDTDTVSGAVTLTGSTVNGRDPARVITSYRVDVCPGDDFFVCDGTPAAWESTGIGGAGGGEDVPLGTFDSSVLAPGTYTLRLSVTSTQTAGVRSQTLNDYYTVQVQAAAPAPVVAGQGGAGGGGCVWIARGRSEDWTALWGLLIAVVLRRRQRAQR